MTTATKTKATAAKKKTVSKASRKVLSIGDSITEALENYFAQLGDQKPADVYDMALAEVESPLIEKTMEFTKGNQSRAAKVLGLSRGTLRKKLKIYGFLD